MVRNSRRSRPQSNGFLERLHRTLLDEHFRIEGRKTFYGSIDQMQKDLDAFLVTNNTKRPHQGRGMKGRTPQQVFKAGLKPAQTASLQQSKKEEKMTPKQAA